MSPQSQKTIFITGSSSGSAGPQPNSLLRKDQLRYVAGDDAKATYAMRLRVGAEEFRKAMEQQFFGDVIQKAILSRGAGVEVYTMG